MQVELKGWGDLHANAGRQEARVAIPTSQEVDFGERHPGRHDEGHSTMNRG